MTFINRSNPFQFSAICCYASNSITVCLLPCVFRYLYILPFVAELITTGFHVVEKFYSRSSNWLGFFCVHLHFRVTIVNPELYGQCIYFPTTIFLNVVLLGFCCTFQLFLSCTNAGIGKAWCPTHFHVVIWRKSCPIGSCSRLCWSHIHQISDREDTGLAQVRDDFFCLTNVFSIKKCKSLL